MIERSLEADYVVIGAGAMALAFVDTLLDETDATVILLDRRAAVGGHWRDAYPFVRLHSPSAQYGVNSRPLGGDGLERDGLNAGLMEMAGRDAILHCFNILLRDRLLPSGRVTWLPAHEWRGEGRAVSLLDGDSLRLRARRRIVDATATDTRLPSTHGPGFRVEPGVRCGPPNDLVRVETGRPHTIIGAGKTAIDTVLHLLGAGVPPDAIRWIRPRDAWLLNRAKVQPRRDFLAQTVGGWAAEMEAAAAALSVDDLFLRWEAAGLMRRIDRGVTPRMFHCAFISDGELAELRRVADVVRLGRVRRIDRERIELEGGAVATTPDALHVHCTASGVPRRAPQPIFQPGRIVLQHLRRCSPPLSAALTAHIEAAGGDDAARNALCPPVAMVDAPRDWVAAVLADARTRHGWSRDPALADWLLRSRLDGFGAMVADAAADPTPEEAAVLARWRAALAPGLEGLARLVDADGAKAAPVSALRTPEASLSGLSRAGCPG